MAEPFPVLPGWVVWLTIALLILTGVLCMATIIAGFCTEKWWLTCLGLVFSSLYFFKVLRKVFQ